ncbi:hypothetical protein ACFYN3_43000, partial [Streptomyces lavendulae]
EPAVDLPEQTEVVDSSPTVPVEPIAAPVLVAVAAESSRPRRATGRVPVAARSSRPVRTEAELLSEARSLTESWPIEKLTGEGIRKALRTSPAKARIVRETLKAERERDAAAAVAG